MCCVDFSQKKTQRLYVRYMSFTIAIDANVFTESIMNLQGTEQVRTDIYIDKSSSSSMKF